MNNEIKTHSVLLGNEEPIQELDEDRLWPHDPDGPSWSLNENVESEPKTRGRKKIPDKWTRVISVSHDKPEDIAVYEVAVDIETKDERLQHLRLDRMSKKVWKPLFHPKQYAEEHAGMQMEQYRLGDRRLKVLAD